MRSRRVPLALAGLLLLPAVAADAADRFVMRGASNVGNDCLSPASPCGTIQYAVDLAGTSDTIKVHAGTYPETVRIDRTFSNLILSGSWFNEFTERTAPEFPQSRIDNDFTGRALTIWADAISINLTLDQFVLEENSGPFYGGAIRIDALNAGDVTLAIVNSDIRDNNASISGGGIFSASADIGSNIDLSISGGDVANNRARLDPGLSSGGGITAIADRGNFTLSIEDSTISGNRSERGGGIHVFANSAASTASVTMARNLIQDNAGYQGGAAHFEADTGGTILADLENNFIVENSAGAGGTLIYAEGSALFLASNEAGSSVDVTSRNDTITANNISFDISAITAGGAPGDLVSTGAVKLSLLNTILRGNCDEEDAFINCGIAAVTDLHINSATVTVDAAYSNLGDTSGVSSIVDLGGNVDVDSDFLNSGASNYHLAASSDLIDAGICSEFICQPGNPPLCFNQRLAPYDDFDGDDRPLQATCDIGADEVPVPEPSSTALVSAALLTLALLRRVRG